MREAMEKAQALVESSGFDEEAGEDEGAGGGKELGGGETASLRILGGECDATSAITSASDASRLIFAFNLRSLFPDVQRFTNAMCAARSNRLSRRSHIPVVIATLLRRHA